jgi:tetratricopeptide (TPR) repeat protein
MRRACLSALTILIAIAFAIPARAQTGTIAGKVIDKDGKPMVGATITIERPEIGLRYEVKTDKGGIYTKTGIEDGTYKVTLIQEGAVLAAVSLLAAHGDRIDRNFDLRNQQQPPATAAAAMSKAQKDAEQKANTETQGAFNAGVTALNSKNYDEALKQFTLAAERRPALPAIFNRLGETYMAAQKFGEAADAYKKATELKADEADYFYNLGIAATRAARFDAGKAAMQKAAQLDAARGGIAFLNLGMLLGEKGQDKDAIDALQTSIKQNPKGADAYYQLGLVQMKNQATMADSLAQFEKYLQLAPKGENAATAKQLVDAVKASAPKK